MDGIYYTFYEMRDSKILKIAFVLIACAIVFELLKDLKNRKIQIKSSINLMVMQFSVITVIIMLYFIDGFLNINFTSWIPIYIAKFLQIYDCGLCEIFGLIFIMYESINILNNLSDIGVPFPIKLKIYIQNIFEKIINKDVPKEILNEDNEQN